MSIIIVNVTNQREPKYPSIELEVQANKAGGHDPYVIGLSADDALSLAQRLIDATVRAARSEGQWTGQAMEKRDKSVWAETMISTVEHLAQKTTDGLALNHLNGQKAAYDEIRQKLNNE